MSKLSGLSGSALGLLFALFSSLGYTLSGILVKVVPLPAIQLVLFRCGIQVLSLTPFITYKMIKDTNPVYTSANVVRFIVIAGVLNVGNMFLVTEALKRLPIGDAMSIVYLNIFVAGIIAFLWLKEPYSLLDGAFAAVAITGVTLVAKPSFLFKGDKEQSDVAEGRAAGVMFALLTAFAYGFTTCLLRKLAAKDKVPAVFNAYSFSILGSLIGTSSLLVPSTFVLPCKSDIVNILLFGLTGLAGQIFSMLALQYEKANNVSVVKSTQIVFALVFQVTY